MLRTSSLTTVLLFLFAVDSPLFGDPCGMVPPITPGGGSAPLVRTGEQRTYVFHRNGVETFVIRPGFRGKVEEFGMLIPFPEPPAIRKTPDAIFEHIAAAIDPPEVVVDLRPVRKSKTTKKSLSNEVDFLEVYDDVKVLREEAVGMYEVAVLAADSPEALERWMTAHSYRYPIGMDEVCEDYIEQGWCFVAIKTKVSAKSTVDAEPGQRKVKPSLPSGGFQGSVQAMGFRFHSEKLVVPMRLSAFNDGELRNIVYVLTDKPAKVRSIPEEYVVRQLAGNTVRLNLTEPLPLRIIGGTENDISDYRRKSFVSQRNPANHNGAAKELFASDLLAADSNQLALPHEEHEKELLRIGERLLLRGGEIDRMNEDALADSRAKIVAKSLTTIDAMTLTVVDGDFPREVVAGENLRFAEYSMPANRNHPEQYDAREKGPASKKAGVRHVGALSPRRSVNHIANDEKPSSRMSKGLIQGPLIAAIVFLGWFALLFRQAKRYR